MAAIRHAKVSTRNPTADTTDVQPADWNASHTLDPGTVGTTDLADGSVTAAKLAPTGVTPGVYTNLNATVTADGRVTLAANGAGGGGGGITNSAGANVLMKSDGTNAVTSQLSDPGGGGAITTAAPLQTTSTNAAALSAALGGVTVAMENITAGASPSALPAAPTVTNDWDPWSGGTRSKLVRVITNQVGSILGSLKAGSVGDVVVLENHGDGSGNQAAGDLRVLFKRTTDLTCDSGLITATVAVVGGSTTYTRSAGSFLSDGFYVGQTSVAWVGYANAGNNATVTITGLTATVMTVATTTQVNEAGTGDEHATANVVGNHMYAPNLTDIVIPYTGAIVLYYDATGVGWIPIGMSIGGRINALDVSEIKISHPLTPSALAAGNNNDYDPSGGQWGKGQAEATWLRLNGDAAGSTLTGLVQYALAGPSSIASQGPIRIIQNVGGPITLSHEDANSSAAHRFNLPSGSIVIPPNGLVTLIYDMQGGGGVNAARWRVLDAVGTFSKLNLRYAVTDTAMAASVVDYNPIGFTSTTRLRLAPSGGTTALHGMVAQEDGAIRIITAYGAGLTLKHQSATETTAANKFYLSGAADITLNVGGSAILVYDATFGAWFCLGKV